MNDLIQTDKRCARCKKTKPLSEFHRSRQAKDGLQGYCKTCSQAFNVEWLAKQHEASAATLATPDDSEAWLELFNEALVTTQPLDEIEALAQQWLSLMQQ